MHLKPNWQFKNIIWTDICNNVLARSFSKTNEMRLARKGGKGWMSDGSRHAPQNQRGDPNALKLSGSGTERIYWAPILSRGKLHVEILPQGFPGETEDGARILVQKVRAAVNLRFPDHADQPKILAVDRGNGFYIQVTGDVTPTYAAALREHGFKNLMGDNCGSQPGKMGDILLHETAVAWIRSRERKTVPARAWEESYEDFSKRLKQIVSEFNGKFDIDGLCREFTDRLHELVNGEGAKLKK